MSVAVSKRAPIDVIVCVHNSPEDVRSCLASAGRTLDAEDRLIIVDDGSAEETMRICEQFAEAMPDQVTLIRRANGSGFCRAANSGLRESMAETVVLLNSDTIVADRWLDRIDACMQSHWQIGVVGPLSNAGGWQSIPEFKTGGPPNNVIHDDPETLRAIETYCEGFIGRFDYPIVELVNGFCLAISREVLDTIGLFDEERFPMGYGEENDFNFRALDAGFLCAIAIDCFVYHAKTKSYTSEARTRLIKLGRENLAEMYGEDRIQNAVKSTQEHPILAAIRTDARKAFRANNWMLRPVPDEEERRG